MDPEIVIVDDDAIVANLTNDVLREIGYTTRVVRDCTQAEGMIRLLRPRLVILDIMMPGIDGLTLLRRLKAEPSLRETKVLVLSGKAFPPDKERALQGGADLFVEKPFNPDAFPDSVTQLIGPAKNPEAASEDRPSRLGLTIWGCRGLPDGDPLPSRFGTRTPCVSLEAPERLFIFDAGTGIVPLGEGPARPADRDTWIFLTHYHPAHLQGLGRFGPAGEAGRTLRIAGPTDGDRGLKGLVQEAFQTPAAVPLKARLQLFELKEEAYELAPGVKLSCLYAHHPGTTLAYSLELEGKKIVYAPDSELFGESATALEDYDEKLARFARDADLLIHDAHFSEEDFAPQSGHSSFPNALLLAGHARVKELILFHLNPGYPDERLEQIEKAAQERAQSAPVAFRCRVAREGLTVSL